MITDQLFAIVLAAGCASRFGSTKQVAELNGVPLVRHAVLAAEAVCGARSALVVGNDWQAVHAAGQPLAGFLVVNESFATGMAGSISAGVRAVAGAADAVILMLADQPLVGEADLRSLVKAWNGDTSTIVCTSHGDVPGPPALFPATYFNELIALEGDRGAQSVLRAHADCVVSIPCQAAGVDVDTPADLLALNDRPGQA